MLLDLIHKRHSTRRYANRPIPREVLLRCIEAARLAPSACNGQPWKFIVVDDHALKDDLCEKAFSGIYSMNKFAKDSTALMVVVSEKEKFISAAGGRIRGTNYCLLDIGIACEHLILQATELGIGSCWIGWFDEKAVKRVLGIPNDRRVDVIISLGYYEEADLAPPRLRKPLEEIHAFNAYE
ncbi:MAG: hypothetical protein A3I73_03905 [Omnitrophica bacterium RIFCSPLOWO2_02_FULL_45_16]|nr:MAG: hypothetical protein A3C51_04705 [Omnitrophica bacterium RIFCSPHIGHO2_02_FULL_46_20]OGW92823.1 MAG: hypothetical protein A3K16_06560 [Omnitrophica bacterium RIFCSPLOWO2_01_FULL_45_24]OGW92849.1 MAG: hypothetical protein A3G36_00575 [Omnitrophica bacterium RIFCSPLOWO2_12_FULL_45_13]OGW99676.1 MAG: hypothetical protein A3I73_03905 [Omnitrophica bacterium RIFCSPLOWO2_02_FULL_45_16]